MNRTQKGFADPLLVIAIVLVVAVGGFVGWQVWKTQQEQDGAANSRDAEVATVSPTADITNFDECVAAGYEALLSYPASCTVPGGEVFIQELTKEEQLRAEGWVEYSSDDLGVSFYYPGDWSVEGDDDDDSNGRLIKLKPGDADAEVWIQNYILGFGAKSNAEFSAASISYTRYEDDLYITYRSQSAPPEGEQLDVVRDVWVRSEEAGVAAKLDSTVQEILETFSSPSEG